MTPPTTTARDSTTEAPPGKQSLKRSAPFFWPLFLITLGILLLFNNLEILPWSIWHNLWKFWPLLLILIGLEMMLGKGRLTNLVITLIGLSLLLVILSLNIPELGIWFTQTLLQLPFPQLQNFLNNYTR